MLSTIKLFVLNALETGRTFLDVRLNESAMRENDLLAVRIGIEIGLPAAMSACNTVMGACAREAAHA